MIRVKMKDGTSDLCYQENKYDALATLIDAALARARAGE